MELRKEGGKSWDIYTHWQMPCAQVRTNGSASQHKCHRHGFQKLDIVLCVGERCMAAAWLHENPGKVLGGNGWAENSPHGCYVEIQKESSSIMWEVDSCPRIA